MQRYARENSVPYPTLPFIERGDVLPFPAEHGSLKGDPYAATKRTECIFGLCN